MTIKIGNYNFDGPFDSLNPLRNESGVYAILGSNGSGEHVVLDVGESSTLRDRVARHDRQNQWRQCGYRMLSVAVHYTNAVTRTLMERELRNTFKPRCGVR